MVEWANLRQCVHWIAFELLPVRKAYEDAYNRPTIVDFWERPLERAEWDGPPERDKAKIVRESMGELFLALLEGRLKAEGCKGIRCKVFTAVYPRRRSCFCDGYEEDHSEIRAEFWDFHKIGWDDDSAWRNVESQTESTSAGNDEFSTACETYSSLRIHIDQLFEAFPTEGKYEQLASPIPGYTRSRIENIERKRELQKRATDLRKRHPDWTKADIAKHIADKDDFQKLKGEGALSSESIEREIRLPGSKRGIDRRTP